MNQVDVTINGRSYAITCDAGQEAHLVRLSRYLDQKVTTLAKSVGQVGDARLLVMASLLVVDELVETDQALKQARGATTANGLPAAPSAATSSLATSSLATYVPPDEALVAETLNRLSQRIETIASLLAAE